MEISHKKFKELERAEAKLNALEAGGVANWEWYSESLKEYNRENEIEDRKSFLIDDLEVAFGECAFEPSERGAGIAFREGAFDEVMKLLEFHKVSFSDIDENV